MFGVLLACISQLWDVFRELVASTSNNQTPSYSTSNSVASTSSNNASTDPSSSQSPPSVSASPSSPTTWDVFLSFRGLDTRYNFIGYLYNKLDSHGIRTFKDDPELRNGEVITDALKAAIRESKIYIIVFSENYATSPWCLDELVEIYKCYQTMQRLVIPVFYKIDASVVRHQIGSFKNAFKKHETRFAGEINRVKQWRFTLKCVADFSGEHISATRSEVDTIDEIIDVILHKINPKTLHVTKYPVGLDSRVNDITTLLRSGSKEGVIKFGIYGMGGVGKTTLAKALYNQLLLESFKDCCFLADVKEISKTFKGLELLQQQLINDILKSKTKIEVHNVDKGTELIRARLCSTKIMVVTDDVDDHIQFESLVGPFAPGSVVIITTRDEELLDKIEVEARYQYKVKELDENESLTLFNRHAYRNAKPDGTFMELSRDILHHAGGLPLALEVFGSSLYKRPEVGWKAFVEKLQRIPNSTIQQRLMISLDALEMDDPMLKKIFLDISCLFIGRNKEWVVKKMESYYSYVEYNIDLLKKRCLLTINNDDKLRMHDLLQGMGREIVRNNCPEEPQNHSRLFISEDIADVLKNNKGTKAIEVIYLSKFRWQKDSLKGASLGVETFKNMSKLRFLYLDSDLNITGNFEQIFENLRWFCWKYCPLEHFPSKFPPQKLVILELPESKMRTLWEPHMVPQVFKNLKALNLSESRHLVTTPDFTKLPSLETIDLNRCTSLEELHISIGSLVKLVSLNLCYCVKLWSLQNGICNLRALESLDIAHCSALEALPLEMGNMTSLKKLDACELNILKLPDSVGRLSKLIELSLRGNKNLKILPDSICNLRALEILNISNCRGLEALPKELGNIVSLKKLDAYGLSVSELPDSVGRLNKLVELTPNGNKNIQTLPDTICNMSSLETLDISYCEKLEILPDQLWKVTGLKELNARSAFLLKKLPDIESGQSALSLNKLNISRSCLTALPSGISQLSNLDYLDLTGCDHLLSIIELPPNLRWIWARGCTSLSRLSNLSNLCKLEELNLRNCSDLTEIVGLEGLSSLKRLELGGCNSSFQYSVVATTLTKRLFQIYSKFGHAIYIDIGKAEFPEWISEASSLNSRPVLDLPPNMSHDSQFLGIILCCKFRERFQTYILKNTTGDIIWTSQFGSYGHASMMVIVPRSMLSLTDEDRTIEFTAKSESMYSHTDDVTIHGIHLLYKD